MKFSCLFASLFVVFLNTQFVSAQAPKKAEWNFDDLAGWQYVHQDNNPEVQCDVDKGILTIYTKANSFDRKKLRTADSTFTTGRYTWKTFISEMGEGDMTSIGSWIYHDDHHEIDFEVGYGRKAVRERLKAAPDEVIAYMTTQDNPYKSVRKAIKTGWHIFELDITLVDGKYKVDWLIDNELVSTVQQTYGEEIPFHIYCSVENLEFMGDKPASKDNYGMYDYVKYVYHK